MTKSLIIVAICSFANILPIMAQATAPKKPATQREANDIAHEALNHLKSIFATTATATDIEKATKAADTIKATTAKIVQLKTKLEATPKPTIPQKILFAQKMLQYESQVTVIIKKMTNTFQTNSEEVNQIIQPAITSFKAKTTPMTNLINIYYPEKEMRGHMDALRGK